MPKQRAHLDRQIRLAADPVLATLLTTAPQLTSADIQELLDQVVDKVTRVVSSGKSTWDLDAYAKRVARNQFYSRIRGQARLMALEPAQHGDESPVSWLRELARSHDLSTAAGDSVECSSELVLGAFERLRPLEYVILMLRFKYDLSGDVTAEKLGYKNRAVINATSARAQAKLRRYLELS